MKIFFTDIIEAAERVGNWWFFGCVCEVRFPTVKNIHATFPLSIDGTRSTFLKLRLLLMSFALILTLKQKTAFKYFLEGFPRLFKQPGTVDKVRPTDSGTARHGQPWSIPLGAQAFSWWGVAQCFPASHWTLPLGTPAPGAAFSLSGPVLLLPFGLLEWSII